MGLFDDLMKKVDKDKIKESLDGISEQIKNIDTDEIKDAFGKFGKDFANGVSDFINKEDEKKDDYKEDVKPDATATVSSNNPASYATSNYSGMRRDDYYTWIPEDDMDAKGKILEVLAADFAEYEIKENVSPSTIGGTGKFMDYSLGIYKDGQPKLFIMLIKGNKHKLRTYRWTKEQAEKAGVTMINFIETSPNRYWYIKERLAKYI